MIYHDRVTITTGGGRDPKGNPLPTVDRGPYRAEVLPVRSVESVKVGVAPLTLYYRLIIGPTAGAMLNHNSEVKWRSRVLNVQGDVEPWMVNGRIHHFEATLRSG